MPKYIKELTLDISGKRNNQTITAKQGDNKSRFIRITLVDGETKIVLEAGENVDFRCLKPDKKSCKLPTTIEEGGTILVELDDNALAVAGLVRADVEINNADGLTLSSTTFYIQVEPSADNGVHIPSTSNQKMARSLDMDGHGIQNLPVPTEDGDAVNKKYVDDLKDNMAKVDQVYNPTSENAQSGIAVEEAIGEKFIKTSASLNLVNKDELLVGRYDDNTALLVKGQTTFVSSNPIYIKGYDRIVFQCYSNTITPRASLFYDKNMNLVAHYSTVYDGKLSAVAYPDTFWQSNKNGMTDDGNLCFIPIPENACYYAFSSSLSTKDTIMIYGIKGENVKYVYPVPYQSYIEAYRLKQDILPVERFIKSYFNSKKLVAIGDSITYGTHNAGNITPWCERLATMLNMTFVNYGIGGSELAKNKTDGSYNPMCIRYADMDDDADLIIVAGGTNDWAHIGGNTAAGESEYQMGNFGDTEITTFYGALDTMCKGLLEKYVGKTIFFMTPIKRYSALSTPYYVQNKRGYTLEDYANAIKKVCGFYGIPVLDMFNECTLNPTIEAIKTAYIEDGTHPNSAGHMIMARQIAGFISKLANDIDYSFDKAGDTDVAE